MLYDGYKESTWYWELVVAGRKVAFVLLSMLGSGAVQVHLASGVLVVLLILSEAVRPFDTSRGGKNWHVVARLELASLMTSFITVWTGFFFLLSSHSGGQKQVDLLDVPAPPICNGTHLSTGRDSDDRFASSSVTAGVFFTFVVVVLNVLIFSYVAWMYVKTWCTEKNDRYHVSERLVRQMHSVRWRSGGNKDEAPEMNGRARQPNQLREETQEVELITKRRAGDNLVCDEPLGYVATMNPLTLTVTDDDGPLSH